MAEEEVDFYKDISDLKRDLEGLKLKKDISNKDLYDAVQKLGQTISDMLEVFAAAADQMQVEEKSYEMQTKKQDMFASKLDKLIEQNKTIAEGMVAIVDLIKEKFVVEGKEEEAREESLFRPAPQPSPIPTQNPFMPRQQTWQPRPEPMMPRATIAPSMAPPIQTPMSMPPMPELSMPPMEPEPLTGLDFPEETPPPLEDQLKEEPKKKGLFGMFKK